MTSDVLTPEQKKQIKNRVRAGANQIAVDIAADTEYSNKSSDLLQKLDGASSFRSTYVCGMEYLGCINSGRRPCIAHIVVNDISYYCVGYDGAITDTIFDRSLSQIKAKIREGFVEDHTSRTWGKIKVFSDFQKAEEEYQRMNNEVMAANTKDLDIITAAKAKIKDGTATAADYFDLSDRGII